MTEPTIDYYASTVQEADTYNNNLFLHDIRSCERCPLHETRQRACPGWFVNLPLDILFVGMSPGADEDEAGRPFVGRAGRKLMSLVDRVKLVNDETMIGFTNIVRCWTGSTCTKCVKCGITKTDEKIQRASNIPASVSRVRVALQPDNSMAGEGKHCQEGQERPTILQPFMQDEMVVEDGKDYSQASPVGKTEQLRICGGAVGSKGLLPSSVGDAKSPGPLPRNVGTGTSQEWEQTGQPFGESGSACSLESPRASSLPPLPEHFLCPIDGKEHVWVTERENRQPTGLEIQACSTWMRCELDMTEPKVVVCLGGVAISLAFPGKKIGEVAGSARAIGSTVYIASYHPSALLHKQSTVMEESILHSLRLAKEVLGAVS